MKHKFITLVLLSLSLIACKPVTHAGYLRYLLSDIAQKINAPIKISSVTCVKEDEKAFHYVVTIRFKADCIMYKELLDYLTQVKEIEPIAIPTIFMYGTEIDENKYTVRMHQGDTIEVRTYLDKDFITFLLKSQNKL